MTVKKGAVKKAPAKRGASRGVSAQKPTGSPVLAGVKVDSMRRAQMLMYSLGRLTAQPFTTALIIAVVGVALALPVAFSVLLANLDEAGARSDGRVQASLFLEERISDERATTLAIQLEKKPEVLAARALSREQSLKEFRELSDFDAALALLDENPLPATIILSLNDQIQSPTALAGFVHELQRLPEVEVAQLDELWLQRLFAIVSLLKRAALLIATMLGVAVTIVVGTTIGLEIQNRRDEIAVTKLVGGTDAFIRRPFLYSGLWYGLGGGLLAIVLVFIALFALGGPVNQLASLYGSDYRLGGLSVLQLLGTLVAGAGLGMLGSWLAVSQQLKDIQPD